MLKHTLNWYFSSLFFLINRKGDKNKITKNIILKVIILCKNIIILLYERVDDLICIRIILNVPPKIISKATYIFEKNVSNKNWQKIFSFLDITVFFNFYFALYFWIYNFTLQVLMFTSRLVS